MHTTGYTRPGRTIPRLLILACLVLVSVLAPTGPAQAQATFRNPLLGNGADPWMQYYNGNYYLAATTWGGPSVGLTMRRSPSIAGLATAPSTRIWVDSTASRCCNMWAPEFHLLNGPNGNRWYLYYTAGTEGTNLDNQRLHVLESAGTDPMGPYTYRAQLIATWAIDGSILRMGNALYLLFSAWEGSNQGVYIAPMSNPWTVGGSRVRISTPTNSWERMGGNTNEAPVALQRNGQTFIIFSASSCNTPDYKLGMLTYNGGNVLSASSWVKSANPVFQRSDANGVYGPGHNGFFKSPDGTEDWIVYHANTSTSQGCGSSRSTRAQKITWNSNGTPNFGTPLSLSTNIAVPAGDPGTGGGGVTLPTNVNRSFQAFSPTDRSIRHRTNLGYVEPVNAGSNQTTRQDATFRIVPGLANAGCYSFQSVNVSNSYLRHAAFRLRLDANNNTDLFRQDATFCARAGLADGSAISLESYNFPGYYIRHRNFELWVDPIENSSTYRNDATFRVINPWG